jgi:hypothetical protein
MQEVCKLIQSIKVRTETDSHGEPSAWVVPAVIFPQAHYTVNPYAIQTISSNSKTKSRSTIHSEGHYIINTVIQFFDQDNSSENSKFPTENAIKCVNQAIKNQKQLYAKSEVKPT